MTHIVDDYKIAAGNNNVAGLVLLSSLADADGMPFCTPVGYSNYARGERRVRANGTSAFAGFPSTSWLLSFVTVKQLAILRTTYEGLVTIRTVVAGVTFANYNAVMFIDENSTLTRTTISHAGISTIGYSDVTLKFTRLALIP